MYSSGGVPRDLLVLFIKCCATLSNDSNRISVPNVREAAIENYSNKKNALEKDSLEESNILETVMTYLKEFVFTQKRTNVFLIDNVNFLIKMIV